MTGRGGRLVLAGIVAGGLGLAMPLAASAQELTPPGPPAQVSVVPPGGAATGGGPQDHGTDAPLIIGVGIAAVVGSLGLFAAAHAAARQD
jgi:hypothetical protein